MTNRQHRTNLRPEHNSSLKIAGSLPGALRELPMPNGTTADLAAPTWIAEIEPTRRWQHGLTQLLEYWDQALRSPRPYLILIWDATWTARKHQDRIARLTRSLSITLWLWNDKTNHFEIGGPHQLPAQPDYSPLLDWNGQPWSPDADAAKSCHTAREPYHTWHRTYQARQLTRSPPINHPTLAPRQRTYRVTPTPEWITNGFLEAPQPNATQPQTAPT